MKKKTKIVKSTSQTEKTSKKRGRPVVNDIMHLQGTIPATPEQLAKVILATPPKKSVKK